MRGAFPAGSGGRRWAAASAVPLPFALVCLAVAVWAPPVFGRWMQEDAWVEWTTFIAFLAAGVVAWCHGVSASMRPRAERVGLLVLGAFCLFVAGEEISWGHRLIGFRPPDLFLERNYQQEANLHNLLKGVLNTRWMVAAIALGYGVMAPVVARVWPPGRGLAPQLVLLPHFALAGGLEVFYPFKFTGELAEAILALAFFLDVLIRTRDATNPRALRWLLGGPAGAVAAGLLVMPVVQAALYGPDTDGTQAVTAELERFGRAVQAGAVQPKMLMKRRVHKRLYSAVRSGYLRLGDGKTSPAGGADVGPDSGIGRKEFFLDHWNQPYWIFYHRGLGGPARVVLYSFGPNRRRDSLRPHGPSPHGGPSASGDDIAVSVEIPVSRAAPWFR